VRQSFFEHKKYEAFVIDAALLLRHIPPSLDSFVTFFRTPFKASRKSSANILPENTTARGFMRLLLLLARRSCVLMQTTIAERTEEGTITSARKREKGREEESESFYAPFSSNQCRSRYVFA